MRPGVLVAIAFVLPALSGCFGGHASDWAYKITGIRAAQAHLNGGDIVVAVVDTGIDPSHPSLKHVQVVWKDYVDNKPDPYDDVGHGSHVAGILVGKGGSFGGSIQGYDLKGTITAGKPKLIVTKAIKSDQTGSSTAVANGITFSVQNKADVICLSLGSPTRVLFNDLPSEIKSAIDSATNAGIVVVASAGNNGEDPDQADVATPAELDLVVAVGAIDEKRKVASFSNRGSESANNGPPPLFVGGRGDPNKKPEIVAPGVNIKSAYKDGNFAAASGTSQAAPFVCGAVALLLNKCPGLRADNTNNAVRRVKTALMETAEALPGYERPHDNAAGYGLLRADRLVDKFGPNC